MNTIKEPRLKYSVGKKEPAESTKREHASSSKVEITAKENAVLFDGRLVKKGESVLVSKDYVARLKMEKDTRFII